jgi:hypothetical protein
MSDAKTAAAPAADRGAWLRDRRRVNEQQEDALAGDYDAQWGEIQDTHQGFLERFLSELPPAGRVLDAACGTGKYFPTTCWPAWRPRQGEDARSAIVIGGSTWLGRAWLRAHYFTLYGRQRPAARLRPVR